MPCTLHFSDDAKFMLKITKLLKLKNEQIDRSDTSCAHDKVEKDKVPIQQLTKSETKDKRQQLTKSELRTSLSSSTSLKRPSFSNLPSHKSP